MTHPRKRGFARIALGAALLASSVAVRPAVGEEDHPFRVAFSPAFFGDVRRADATAAVRAWQETILEPDRIPFNPNPLVCEEIEELADALRRCEVDAVALQFTEFTAMPPDLLETDLVYLNEKHEGAFDKYVLLVPADAGIATIDQLQGKRLITWNHQRSCLMPVWLDHMLAERRLGSAHHFFASVVPEAKPAKVVLPVFFGQADACLITEAGFNNMCELNPQVGRKLRVLATSPDIVASFLCFRRDYRSADRPRVENAIRNLHQSAAGRQVLTIFGCDQITPAAGSVLQSAWELWKHRSPPSDHERGSTTSGPQSADGDRP